MPFRDRSEAGRRLGALLGAYRDRWPVVLALPRGGVPVAAEIAAALAAPLDLLIVRKIGVPEQPELAMGAVADGSAPIIVRNDDLIAVAGVSESAFAAARDRALAEIERRRQRYLGQRAPLAVTGRAVIVVDDGVATGASMGVALVALRRRNPAWLAVAVPVGADETLGQLRELADEVVCIETHTDFGAIGFYYDDFRQLLDDEVVAILDKAHTARGGG